jgi:hypothetical protein
MASDSGHNIPNPSDVMKWASTQPFTNILLILILGAIAWVSHHVLTVSVPSHLQQIQDGYERIEKANREDRALIIQQYDKWFEYIQKRNGDPTGRVTPENIIPELWRSYERDTSGFSSVVGARGISHRAFDGQAEVKTSGSTTEVITPKGTKVSWSSDSPNARIRVVPSGNGSSGSGGSQSGRGYRFPETRGQNAGDLQRWAKPHGVF